MTDSAEDSPARDDSEPKNEDGRRSLFENRSFGQQLSLGENPALLVVDMMYAFTNNSFDLGADLDAEVASIRRLMDGARKSEIPVIHVYSSFDSNDTAEDILWIRKQGGAEALQQGTEAVEIDDRLSPKASETVLRKRYPSAFFGTDLVSRLNAIDVDTLAVTGCTTSGCVRATVIDAVQYGYVPLIPEEAVGDRDWDAHKQSLFDMEMKYANVLSEVAVREYFETGAAPNGRH